MIADAVGYLEFPNEIPVKVMGRSEHDLTNLVVNIVRKHVPELNPTAIRSRKSRGGHYVSVTVNVRASNKSQLDAIYRELSGHEQVLMAL